MICKLSALVGCIVNGAMLCHSFDTGLKFVSLTSSRTDALRHLLFGLVDPVVQLAACVRPLVRWLDAINVCAVFVHKACLGANGGLVLDHTVFPSVACFLQHGIQLPSSVAVCDLYLQSGYQFFFRMYQHACVLLLLFVFISCWGSSTCIVFFLMFPIFFSSLALVWCLI